jgi:NCAIR mutase (PurE)-related protein
MNGDIHESLRVQLTEVNERVRTHMRAFWQMPMAYLGIVAVALGTADAPPRAVHLVVAVLAIAGIAVAWAMRGSVEGAHRGVDQINRIETALGLRPTAKKRRWHHVLPHLALVFIGIGACIVSWICTR